MSRIPRSLRPRRVARVSPRFGSNGGAFQASGQRAASISFCCPKSFIYWDRADLAQAARRLVGTTKSGSHILLVHWLGETDYPMSGDASVTELRLSLGDAVVDVRCERHEQYRLDLWHRR